MTASEGSWRQVQKPSRWLTIIHQVTAAVGDSFWDQGVCCGKSGTVLASGERGAWNLMEIVVAPPSVWDIWSGLGLVGTDHGTRVGAAAARTNNWPGINACWIYFSWGWRLLGNFGQGLYRFRIFGLDRRQLRVLIPWRRSREGYNLVTT